MLYNVAYLANRMMVMVQERGKAETAIEDASNSNKCESNKCALKNTIFIAQIFPMI
jgi:hypothetical protein